MTVRGPAPASQEPGIRSVLLVGFMASGKTTVGRRVADALGWRFVDVDARVEADAGATVAEIFRDHGEDAFRAREQEATAAALREGSVVIATGGGWPASPGRMESLPPDTLSVWLRVAPPTAVARAALQGHARPLLDVPDPEGRARELIGRRTPFYERATLHLDADDTSPEALARAIVEAVRARTERRTALAPDEESRTRS